MPLHLNPTFGDRLAAADRPLAGLWACAGSATTAEILAGSGIDWLLIDMEHSVNDLAAVQAQLRAVSGYPVTVVVRVPANDPVVIKQVLDAGAQNLLVPMIGTVAGAQAAVAAVRYPPRGIRGVGSALARSARWNRVPDYLAEADDLVSLTVQVESGAAVDRAGEIAAVDGVDAVFVGPADLAASLGQLGNPGHPDVVAAIDRTFDQVRAAGKPVGVNAFDPVVARRHVEAGAAFVAVGADVVMLARGSERVAADWQ